MSELRKWHLATRPNGTFNVIETDFVGIDRVLFNLRHSVSENDARAISVARESLSLLKKIKLRFDRLDMGEISLSEILEYCNEIINQSEQ